MDDQQSARSAWPDPPAYYKRYTQDNVDLLKVAKTTGVFPEMAISTPSVPEFQLQDLEPPSPPTDEYTVFDQKWQIDDHLPTLDELGVKQLFPETPIDRVQELKRLNRSLIVQFLDLLDVLVNNPEEFGNSIENISTIFINMHHILNAYRPHQARETLRLLMENQLARKREQTAELRARPATAKVSFSKFKELGVAPGKWAQIDTPTLKSYFCSLWPADIPRDHVEINTFIQLCSNNITNQVPRIIPVDTYSTAINVVLSYNLNKNITEEYQLSNFGFVFDRATDQQKNMYIRNLVDGIIVKKDTILSKSLMLSIKVISTYPENCTVLISPASRVTLVDNKSDTSDQVLELEKSLETMSLAGEDIGNIGKENHISSLQKAYQALFEVVCFPFLYKDWVEKLNIECPKGVLLYGPPGVGKTFLVSSIAKRCNAKMFIIQGPEIFGPFIGESEERLRAKFTEAREYAIRENVPVILFIDEIDALTPRRDNSQSHENRMVAQLLTLMDGVKSRGRLIIVGATNRPNSIDPALRRPGRFDREISMEPPNAEDRYALFQAQLNKMPLDSAVDIEILSIMTNGYVAADINAMCREAAMAAVQRASKHSDIEVLVTMSDFKSAFATVGPSMQRGFQVQVEKMKWDDVGGLEDVKKRLKQAVEWPLLYKNSFKRLGLKPPRGILLYGPPGCSKTTLVKVIASSANVAFLSINGAQLYSPFVVRTTFQKARASAPSIIFLDETEAIVGKRNMGNGGSSGDSVQERVLSTLLNEMDGVESAESVLVVGATNRPDMLDAALMRPGRFDQAVYVPPPDEHSRYEILKIHTKHMPLSSDIDLMDIASRTNYYTGADLQNICRESAMEALRSNKLASDVTMANFNKSLATIPPSLNAESVKEYSKKPHSAD
ncbi:hypothetical protein INT48_000925 [Thamnidium elegans]|uniref:Mediator of RNA polymerase II transcription subunit 7 n=1 Tax=Thamnidium elegans TaxID=101142 RepID=A0A8H7SQ72_9FUNG|nr:hypothetical protein INT48_000925 [Thamnidium elegans]